MAYVIVPKHYKVNPETVYIVYDVDDTLWDFVGKLCGKLSIDYNSWKNFYVTSNNWDPQLIEKVCYYLTDDSLFEDIEFYGGIADILRPALDLGVNVELNSNAPTTGMIDLKREQLKAAVPGLKDENMTFNLIIPNQPSVKTLPDNTAIFVDDNPYHIAGSTARFDVMPKCPWNTSKDGLTVLGNRPVTKLDNLQQINDFVYRRVKFYLEFAC